MLYQILYHSSFSIHFYLANAATTQTQTWKSMPSLIKTSAAPPPPMPLVGSCYPTRPEDIFVEQPFKQLKETFEQKSRQHYLNLDQFQGKTIETGRLIDFGHTNM